MSKVHIALVGGQTMPVYNGIVYTKPDKVIFIYSESSESQKEAIIRTYQKYNSNNIEFCETTPMDPVDQNVIEKAANYYAEKYADEEVSINISSGTKPWAYYFTLAFQTLQNATIFYVDQNNIVWDLKEKTYSDPIPFNMDIQFELNGNPIIFYKKYSDYTEDDLKLISAIEKCRRFNFTVFNALTILEKKKEKEYKNNESGRFNMFDSYLEWNKKGESVLAIKNKKGKTFTLRLNTKHSLDLLMSAAWFEIKIARMLSQWQKIKEIRHNCIFPVQETANTPNINQAKNEIDLIADIGNKMLFVECKTFIQDSTAIDKFKTAATNYGGNGSQRLFIVDAPIKPKEREKMKESKIIPFSLQEHYPYEEVDLINLLEEKCKQINT